MKKNVLIVFIVLAMILSMAACAEKPDEETAESGRSQTVNSGDTGTAVNGDGPVKAGDDTQSTVNKQGDTIKADNGGSSNSGSTGNSGNSGTGSGSDSGKTDDNKDNGNNNSDNNGNGSGGDDPIDDDEDEFPVYTEEQLAGFIKVISFNVEGLREGGLNVGKEAVIKQLREYDADIVGLQELDQGMARSNNEDQIVVLAQALGYKYYGFDDIQGFGYGHGILSKFPIKSHNTVLYNVVSPTDGDHVRGYGRYELDVNGKTLVFYNTHLTLGELQYRGEELKQLFTAMQKDKYAVATGDFNTHAGDFFFHDYFDENKLTVLNGGGDYGLHAIKTCPSGDNPSSAIDNIIVSKKLKHYWDKDRVTGIIDVKSTASDHNMIYTYINFPDK